LHHHFARTRHNCHKSIQTQTTFEKLYLVIAIESDARIHNHMKGYRIPFALDELLLRYIARVLGQVFNDRELHRHAHLRGRKTDSWSITQRFAHIEDKSLDGIGE